MNKKIRVGYIFHKNNIFLSGDHFDNTYYNFFIKALGRNPDIDLTLIPTEEIFDSSKLKNKFDVILLWEKSEFGMPREITNLEKLDIPIISKMGDPSRAKKSISVHEKWNIDYYIHFLHEDFFYELYPKEFRYKKILFGLESSLYEKSIPYDERINDKILLTGSIGNSKPWSRIINDIKMPEWNAYRVYYLRTKCSKLPFVEFVQTHKTKYVNDNYPKLLEQYSASIAATTFNPNIKYWENSAAGCLTFMEISDKNRGKYLGYVDGESAIFINETNYLDKFHEYLNDKENPKWKEIARKGREYSLRELNNDNAANELALLMKDLI